MHVLPLLLSTCLTSLAANPASGVRRRADSSSIHRRQISSGLGEQCGAEVIAGANQFQTPAPMSGVDHSEDRSRPEARAYHSGLAGYQPASNMAILILCVA